jgi:hypothetical protein
LHRRLTLPAPDAPLGARAGNLDASPSRRDTFAAVNVEDQSRLLEAIHDLRTYDAPGAWISVEALEAEVGWESGDVRTGPALHALCRAGYVALHADVREVAITEMGLSIVRASERADH